MIALKFYSSNIYPSDDGNEAVWSSRASSRQVKGEIDVLVELKLF